MRDSLEKGRGVFTTTSFIKGDFLCEYAGEVISYVEAQKREIKYANDSTKGCFMYYFKHNDKKLCVDATLETNRLGRLINHSKFFSNCHAKVFEIEKMPYLVIYASREIVSGDELLFDYGDRNRKSLESYPWLAK
jgi:histone-lysine N-methyltransferase SETD8